MGGAVTLDTSAYSEFMRGDRRVLEEIGGAEVVYLPLFVLGELHYGFRGGKRLMKNLEELNRFLSKPTVREWLPTLATAEIFGEVKDRLKQAGEPVPINDVWIASSCFENGSKVVTFDEHFEKVAGLRVVLLRREVGG